MTPVATGFFAVLARVWALVCWEGVREGGVGGLLGVPELLDVGSMAP